MYTTARDVLAQKPNNDIYAVAPHDSVFKAVQLMAKESVGALLVISEGEILGMLTERDYSRKVVLAHRSSSTTRVHEIMTTELYPVTPEHKIENCLSLMTEHNVRYLPVYEYSELIGLISMGDIVRAIITDREFTIEQLTKFIVGPYTDDVPALYIPRLSGRVANQVDEAA